VQAIATRACTFDAQGPELLQALQELPVAELHPRLRHTGAIGRAWRLLICHDMGGEAVEGVGHLLRML